MCLAAFLGSESTGFSANSAWVFPAADGRLLYQRDSLGNRVPDFSNVGYRGGVTAIPEVPVKVTVSPVAGDDGASIQAAMDRVAALPLEANGFRGAVLLTAGEYQIADHIEIRASGIVLRGAGDSTAGTVLRASGAGQRTLVRVTGSGSRSTVSGTTHSIIDQYVPAGTASVVVDGTSGLAPGDRVIVKRPSTRAWINALGMNQLENPWAPGSRDQSFDRIITRIEGARIFLDAPVTTALDQQYGGGTIYKYTWSGRIQNVGIERVRGLSDYNVAVADDEDHAWTFISFSSCEHGWVRNVTSEHFGNTCVGLFSGAKWITVASAHCLEPVSQVTGGRRYAFFIDDAQLCLVRHCYTHEDRHQFVTGSDSSGPNAFVECVSDSALSDAGPHHRWASGILWDAIQVNGHGLNLQNRGNLGSGHGWAGGNCVAWNCEASGGFVVQNPPTARNWLVGGIGPIKTGTVHVGPHDTGTYDAHGAHVSPRSLYHAQLRDRLAAPRLQTREYIVGDFDEFSSANDLGDAVPVDPAWLAQIIERAGGAGGVTHFDALAGGKWVPWTHRFTLDAGDAIVSATLWVSVRGLGVSRAGVRIFFDSLTNGRPVTNFFASIGTSGSTVLTIDLAGSLPLLADGRLNLAVQNELAVDWSALELRVTPAPTGVTNACLFWPGLMPGDDAWAARHRRRPR